MLDLQRVEPRLQSLEHRVDLREAIRAVAHGHDAVDGHPALALGSEDVVERSKGVGADDLGDGVFDLSTAVAERDLAQRLHPGRHFRVGVAFHHPVEGVGDVLHEGASRERDLGPLL